MAHIKTKIEELTAELQVTVENYNKVISQKDQLFQRINQLQGALTALNDLDDDHTTNTEAT